MASAEVFTPYGHADLQILRRYLALIDDDLRQAHDKHGAVDHVMAG